jgi:hypothetical protein
MDEHDAKMIREVDEPCTPASFRWIKNATVVVLCALGAFMALAMWMHERDAAERPRHPASMERAPLIIETCDGVRYRMAVGLAITVIDDGDGCLRVLDVWRGTAMDGREWRRRSYVVPSPVYNPTSEP